MISQKLHDLLDNWLSGGMNAQVILQDQTTRIFGAWAARELDALTYTLAADAEQFDTEIDVTAPSNMSAGEMLFLTDGVGVHQLLITAVTPDVGFDTITLDRPLDKDFAAINTEIYRTSDQLNIAGGTLATPLVYRFPHSVTAQYPQILHITFMAMQMTDADPMDDAKFGGTAALTYGLDMRVQRSTGEVVTFGNVKTNGRIKHWGTFQYDDRSGGGGDYGFGGHVFFRDWFGGVLELRQGDYIEILAQDDLDDLTGLSFLFGGHFTNDY